LFSLLVRLYLLQKACSLLKLHYCFQLSFDLTETLRKLIISDLQFRFPQANEATIRRKFIARVLAREDVIRAYGFDPKTETD
jgi:hypothetical protein